MAKPSTHTGGSATMEPPAHTSKLAHSHETAATQESDAGNAKVEQPMSLAPPPAAPAQQVINDLSNLVDPYAALGTRFSGPVLSGPVRNTAGAILSAGIAVLCKRARITYQNGTFTLPILLPPGAILMRSLTQVVQAFNGTTPTVKIGATSGGAEIMAAADLTAAAGTVVQADVLAQPANSGTTAWTMFLTLTLAGAPTQGIANVQVTYTVPARVLPD